MKSFRKKDPYSKREAEKYQHPVPSREFITEFLKKAGHPLSLKEFLAVFNLTTAAEKEGMQRRLKAMDRDGQIIRTRRGRYELLETMEVVTGCVQGHQDGFGFVTPDQGGSDIFLPAREMRAIFPLDRVRICVSAGNGQRPQGKVIEILERNTTTVVGRFYQEKGVAFLDPDDKRISQAVVIPRDQSLNAKVGEYVWAKILSQPTRKRSPTAKIVEVLGTELTQGIEVDLALRSHDIPHKWPYAVKKQVSRWSSTTIRPSEIKRRKDLRSLPFITIDGEDAQDFDDAVYCESCEKGWKLYVAIADVSHYVKPGSPLDREAERRGNSLYFSSRVVPMLPDILSNGLCSLQPKKDRLAVVCEMSLDRQGKVIDHVFYEAVIHSHGRLTYTAVAQYLSGIADAVHRSLGDPLQRLYQIYRLLIKEKQYRGAIEFNTVSTQVIFNSKGKIESIVPVERNEAHKMIEEMMLLANVTTASLIEKSKLPILYRVHPVPEKEKLLALRDFLKALGLRLSGGKQTKGVDYARLLKRVAQRPDAHLLQMVILRSLPQALYGVDNLGHFGLSYLAYCHFTSPIRRYADLLVHRAIKFLLKKTSQTTQTAFPYTTEQMHTLATHCSMTERRADSATRSALDWLKCDYMQDKVGQVFEGIVVEVTSFGLFIELKTIYVQGLWHVTTLPKDHYHYDMVHHVLQGVSSGVVYRLGDTVRVQVLRVDLHERRIDFGLPDIQPVHQKKCRKKR